MNNLLNFRNLVVGILTTGIGVLMTKRYYEISTDEIETITSVDGIKTMYDVSAACPQYQWLDASEFSVDVQETAQTPIFPEDQGPMVCSVFI